MIFSSALWRHLMLHSSEFISTTIFSLKFTTFIFPDYFFATDFLKNLDLYFLNVAHLKPSIHEFLSIGDANFWRFRVNVLSLITDWNNFLGISLINL